MANYLKMSYAKKLPEQTNGKLPQNGICQETPGTNQWQTTSKCHMPRNSRNKPMANYLKMSYAKKLPEQTKGKLPQNVICQETPGTNQRQTTSKCHMPRNSRNKPMANYLKMSYAKKLPVPLRSELVRDSTLLYSHNPRLLSHGSAVPIYRSFND